MLDASPRKNKTRKWARFCGLFVPLSTQKIFSLSTIHYPLLYQQQPLNHTRILTQLHDSLVMSPLSLKGLNQRRAESGLLGSLRLRCVDTFRNFIHLNATGGEQRGGQNGLRSLCFFPKATSEAASREDDISQRVRLETSARELIRKFLDVLVLPLGHLMPLPRLISVT